MVELFLVSSIGKTVNSLAVSASSSSSNVHLVCNAVFLLERIATSHSSVCHDVFVAGGGIDALFTTIAAKARVRANTSLMRC